MTTGMLRRIERLEDAGGINGPRAFILWDHGPGYAAAEIDRLRRERRITDVDQLIVVGWLPVVHSRGSC